MAAIRAAGERAGIIDSHGAFPAQSAVGTYTVRELDGVDEAASLMHTLCEFERFIERLPYEA
ncbi:MAG TPA: hypothetical protein VME43_16500 [Bryobacteraceae bacterium]|nr:hypothetical protein [Bryobacteraceae bacterium]